MARIFVLAPKEDWIVDRLVKEWYQDNSDISTQNVVSCDVIWLLAEWCYRYIDLKILKEKKVVTTVHHIVPEKLNNDAIHDFMLRDSITNMYHVPNAHTAKIVSNLTQKPIQIIPYWANQRIWKKTGNKREIRKKFGIQDDEFVIGSFQRDTEGKDLITPKLEKGPDLLVDAIGSWSKDKKVHVLLGGWRRQYILTRLKSLNVKVTYIELPTQEVLNEMYQAVDLYPVTARYEGGPQSLIECGLLGVPVVSRDIGIASDVLSPSAISDDVFHAKPEIPNVDKLILPLGFNRYRDMFINL